MTPLCLGVHGENTDQLLTPLFFHHSSLEMQLHRALLPQKAIETKWPCEIDYFQKLDNFFRLSVYAVLLQGFDLELDEILLFGVETEAQFEERLIFKEDIAACEDGVLIFH